MLLPVSVGPLSFLPVPRQAPLLSKIATLKHRSSLGNPEAPKNMPFICKGVQPGQFQRVTEGVSRTKTNSTPVMFFTLPVRVLLRVSVSSMRFTLCFRVQNKKFMGCQKHISTWMPTITCLKPRQNMQNCPLLQFWGLLTYATVRALEGSTTMRFPSSRSKTHHW